MWCPDYDSTDYTDPWARRTSAGNGVTYIDLDPVAEVFKTRHIPMCDQAVPEVPWQIRPLVSILAREVFRRAGRQRAWTGRNFRKAA